MPRPVLLVGVVAAVAVSVLALRACDTPTSHRSVPVALDRPVGVMSVGVGPTGRRFGLPVGWSHDGPGARAAAVAAVAATGMIARAGFVTRGDLLATLATTRFRGELIRTSTAQLDQLLAGSGQAGVTPSSLLFDELPLTAHLDRVDGGSARVEVWSVLVVGVPDRAARQVWRTVTVDVAWERDDWHVDGWTAVAGPTPMLDTDTIVASTGEVAVVAGWAPVGGSR